MSEISASARRLNRLAAALSARRYLEIGVRDGETFMAVKVEGRFGVDPHFVVPLAKVAGKGVRLIEQTSDVFFDSLPVKFQFDLVFIDGLHVFEQVVRDLQNTLLHTHRRSAILIDDTKPNDVFSTIRDMDAAFSFRKQAGLPGLSWHGDVFKVVAYIHDFLPGLNYRTIVQNGNPQTLVWRSKSFLRKPQFGSLESISRLTYFDLHAHISMLRECGEDEAIATCIAEITPRASPGEPAKQLGGRKNAG